MASQTRSAGRRLSVAMIVRDEQEVIGTTIESVQSIADEIIVLDTGSTDQTSGIAGSLGAKILRAPWKDDFSAARNRLLDEVTGEWVFWLDAGERMAVETAAKLRSFVDEQADPNRVYLLMVELPPAEPNGSSEQIAQPRLMPGQPGLWYTGRICETLRPSMERLGIRLDTAPGRIVRHARNHQEEVKTAKARRTLRLIAQETTELGETPPRLLIAEGEACENLHDQTGSRQAFRKAIETAPRGSTELLEGYYGLLTSLEGDPNQQLAVCLEALELHPFDAQLLVAMGGYLQNQGRLDLAARSFDLAIQHGQINVETWHLCEIFEMAAVCLSLTRQLQGQPDEACRVLEEAIQRSPTSLRLCRHLVDLYARLDRQSDALHLTHRMVQAPADRVSLDNAVRGACEAVRQNWTAALGLLQSAYLAGCQDPICLRWLTFVLLSNAQTEAALPVLRQWLIQEPNSPEAQAYLAAIEKHSDRSTTFDIAATARRLRLDSPQGIPNQTPESSVVDCISPVEPGPDWAG